ncbi:MAG: hypothetical protein Q8L78_00245 [Coxiellaceae bacterium]|nr:hypothetical protein [Coxiellaceae bacterium]
MPIQDALEAAAYTGIHAGVTTAAHTTRSIVSTGLDVIATPSKIAIEMGVSLAITLTANLIFWTGKNALQAGWFLLSATASTATTAASNTYSYLFPPRPLAIKWHEEEATSEESLTPRSPIA